MSENENKDLLIGERKTLLTNRLCDFVSARVKNRRTGSEGEFYRFEFTDWVNIIAITPSQELVVIRQFRFGTEREEIEIPGGAVEKGEDPLAAGLRELLEETGFKGRDGRIIGRVCPNPAIQNNWCYTVLVEGVEQVSEQDMDDMENISVELMPLSQVAELVHSGQISHGLVLNGLMFYYNLRP